MHVNNISSLALKSLQMQFINVHFWSIARQLYQLIRRSQSARKITSVCHSTQYVRAGCTRVQSRFCEGLEVGTRRDAAQGMFRRVGRTHTGGGKTWWPTGCGIHQRRCSAYLLRDLVFFIVFRAHAYLEGTKRDGKREKEREKGDASDSL